MNISVGYSSLSSQDRYRFLKTDEELLAEAAERPGWKREATTAEISGKDPDGKKDTEASALEKIDVVSISEEAKRRYGNIMQTRTRRRRAGDSPEEAQSSGSQAYFRSNRKEESAAKSAAQQTIEDLRNQISELNEQISKATQEVEQLKARASTDVESELASPEENPEVVTAEMAVRELKNKLLQVNEQLASAMRENSGHSTAGWRLGIPAKGGCGGSGSNVGTEYSPMPASSGSSGGNPGQADAPVVDLPGGEVEAGEPVVDLPGGEASME